MGRTGRKSPFTGGFPALRHRGEPGFLRQSFRRELAAWLFLPIMLGAVEGGTMGVIANVAFEGVVDDGWLALAVALLTGAPAFANITSFLWASVSHGKHKIRFLMGLQIGASLLVAMIAAAPHSPVGLLMLVLGAVGARMCWAGVVTLRSTVWRANYPQRMRARMAGSLAIVQAIMLSGAGLGIGLMMRQDAGSFHWIYPLAAMLGLLGAALYGKVRMRGHSALLRAENEDRAGRRVAVTPAELWRILWSDKSFREYMGAMFVFGIGNLSMKAPLVIILKDRFGFGYLEGILIMQTIPYAMIPIAVPFWSRLFDRMHIVEFRSIHCWSFMSANILFLIAALTGSAWLLFVAAACMGIGFGGGILGWNLGHHAFTTTLNASRYMGVHVTLTGVRGLIGPLIAVSLYNRFEAWSPGAGPWVLAICIGLTFLGAAGFFHLQRDLRRQREEAAKAIREDPVGNDEAAAGGENAPADSTVPEPPATPAPAATATARE